MDQRKIRIYCFLIKSGKATIDDVPIELRAAVTENMDKITIADLEEIKQLKDSIEEFDIVVNGICLDIQSLLEYITNA